MSRQKAESRKPKAEQRRRGVTLLEVLMSIMILSIGVISLATLFPAAILRSVQATQLTNATILRYNAEAAIDVELGLVLDPDGNADLIEHRGEHYIVDPLGWNRATAGQIVFGTALDTTDPIKDKLDRYAGLSRLQTEAPALNAVTLPDSWVDFVDGDFTSLTSPTNQVTLPDTVVVSDLPPSTSPIVSRIVLFDPVRRSSHTRIITGTTTNLATRVIGWDNNSGQLTNNDTIPSGFQPGSFRIQTRETRYTWLLTVRNNASGVASVDVVVMFRRPDPPAGETHYGPASGDSADNVFTKDSRSASISWAFGDEPALKKGGFILDAENARWYRIQNITDETDTTAVLQLDVPAFDDGNAAIVIPGVIYVYPIDNKLRP